MNETELRRLAAEGEGARLEFKERTSEGLVRASAKGAAAFSTSGTGRIFFGVRDDGTVFGQQVSDQKIRDLANAYRQAVQPAINPLIERVPVGNGREVIVVTVERGQVGPYRCNGVPYERLGSTNQQMREERFQQLLLERLHGARRWENEDLDGWSVADLDEDEIVRTLEEGIRNGRVPDPGTRDTEKILESFHLIKAGQLVRAAAVLFGRQERLARDLPQCMLKQAQMAGSDPGGSEFRDFRPPLHSNLFQLYEAGQRFIIEHSQTPSRIVTAETGIASREDFPTYPPEAVREALANALCHRDYSAGGGAVTIRMFDDHLEIFSVGSLHFGLTPERLFRHHDSHPWNPLIADVLYYRRIIDAFGTGIGRMSAASDAGLSAPVIEDADGSVLVVLTASVQMSDDGGTAETERQLNRAVVLAGRGQLTRRDLEEDLGVPNDRAEYLIRVLVRDQRIRRVGRSPDDRRVIVYRAVDG